MQITAPMPLEGIGALFEKAVEASSPPSSLLAQNRFLSKGMVYVTSGFFQTSPGKVTNPGPDVMAFFSLILSYVKNDLAGNVDIDIGLKNTMSIMPRTDFVTMYNQIKSSLPSEPGSLYSILKVLVCYKYNKGGDLRFVFNMQLCKC
jgi:hypothetical protein